MSGRVRRTRARRADLSQHFLRTARAARLVQITSIDQSDFVIEIGAGRGALTEPLVHRAGKLRAVEIDRYLAGQLQHRYGQKVDVVAADFLSLELPDEPYKVIGNIPYARTTEIVRKLVGARSPPEEAWLIVQRELAWRFCGQPYGPESLWSLRLKPGWHVEILDRLSPNEFNPPPKVQSVLLWLSRRGHALLSPAERRVYDEVLAGVFSEGATIRQAFRPWLSKIQLRRLAEDLRFDLNADISTLVFEQWLGVVRFVCRK